MQRLLYQLGLCLFMGGCQRPILGYQFDCQHDRRRVNSKRNLLLRYPNSDDDHFANRCLLRELLPHHGGRNACNHGLHWADLRPEYS